MAKTCRTDHVSFEDAVGRGKGADTHEEDNVATKVEGIGDLGESKFISLRIPSLKTSQLTSLPNPFGYLRSIAISDNALSVMSSPCPISPNITAKRKGKVMIVNKPGLTSSYVATPYASMMAWKPSVNLFVRWNVGGFLCVRSSCRIAETLVPAFSCSGGQCCSRKRGKRG